MRLGFVTILALVVMFAMQTANAGDEIVVRGYEDAFDSLRVKHNPNYRGASVEQAIKAMFEESDEDKGTYSPTEYWKRDGDIRRVKPPSLSYQGRTFFKYSRDDISDVEKWEKELELTWRYSNWSGKFRVSDENVFAYKTDPLRWEKGNVRHKTKSTKITLGSFGAVFGRGLAVNIYEDRTLDFDNEVDGIKIEHEEDDVEYTFLAGSRKLHNDSRNANIKAARIEVPIAKGSKLGVHIADIDFIDFAYDPETNGVYHYDVTGADVSYRIGDFRVAAEAVHVGREPVDFAVFDADSLGTDGRGYYVNAGYNGDGYAVTAEYKDYTGVLQPFAILPPLKRFREQSTADPVDDKGYAVDLNWNPIGDGSYFVFDYAQSNIHEGGYPYREFGATYFSSPARDTTWVFEYWDVNLHGDFQKSENLTISQKLNSDWVVSSHFEHEELSYAYSEPHTDYIMMAEAAYRSQFNIIYTHEESGKETDEETSWGIWELKFRPDDEQEVNVVYGARREGYVCSGGVCRIEPAFDGLRVDYLVRF